MASSDNGLCNRGALAVWQVQDAQELSSSTVRGFAVVSPKESGSIPETEMLPDILTA